MTFLPLLFDFLVSSQVSILITSSDLGAWLESASEDASPLASAGVSVAVLVPSNSLPGFTSAAFLCPHGRDSEAMAKVASSSVSQVSVPRRGALLSGADILP